MCVFFFFHIQHEHKKLQQTFIVGWLGLLLSLNSYLIGLFVLFSGDDVGNHAADNIKMAIWSFCAYNTCNIEKLLPARQHCCMIWLEIYEGNVSMLIMFDLRIAP